MNINLQSFFNDTSQFNNIKDNSQNIQNNSNIPDNLENTSNVNLNDLSVGDVFSGKIVNITNYEVDILLDNDQHINATMQQALELNIGDKLLFQVKDRNDSQIFIRPVADNETSKEYKYNELINKSLNVAGFSTTAKNVSIVKELINYGQPIDKQSISNILKLTAKYGSENIGKLIDMNRSGIEINENNLKMYDEYAQSKHQITSNINSTINGIIKYITDIPKDALDFDSNSNSKLNSEYNQNNGQIDNLNNNNLTEASINDKSVNHSLTNKVDEIIEFVNKLSDILDDDTQDKTNVKSSVQNQTYDFEQAKTFSDISDILKHISDNGMGKDEFVKNLKSDKLEKAISDIFEKKLFINTDILSDSKVSSDEKSVKEQLEKIYEKLNKITELVKENIDSSKNNTLTDNSSNLKNNMTFMSDLNNIESYIQLPVKFSEGKTNGDLYVYNRKRGKLNADDTLTAFLHLDMQYLGATDVNISMKKNNVTTKFTLNDDMSSKIVSEHIDELVEKLETLGYKVSVTTETSKKNIDSTEKFNPLLPLTENNEKTVTVKRYALDIRT